MSIGDKVKKKSGKPFKSGFKINTIKGFIPHPFRAYQAAIFEEDDSFVSILILMSL